MNQAHLKQWIEALRSGEYSQTKNCLRNEEGYCCLGVLCDISPVGGWLEGSAEEEFRIYVAGDTQTNNFPPKEVPAWLEVPSSNFCFRADYMRKRLKEKGLAPTLISRNIAYVQLSELNDNGVPFSFIADLLQDILDGELVINGYGNVYEPRKA